MNKKVTFYTAGLVAVFIILCCPMLGIAQSSVENEDVIYLNDGTVLRGTIIEKTTDGTIKIKTASRNVFVVTQAEVDRITSEAIPNSNNYKKSGYINYTGIDILHGQSSTTPRFHMVNGYQFSPRLSAGIGVGFVPYNDPLGLLPVFIEGRFQFLEANNTPFLFLRTGYSFSVLADEDLNVDSHRGGLTFNPGVGVTLYTQNGYGWYISAGLNIDNSSFDQQRWDGRNVETDIDYRRFQFGVGLSF